MPQNVLIIGAVAAGPKAACRLKRLEPDARVTLIDRDEHISYGGCGIPYFISGDVSDARELQSTSFHMVRDEAFFRRAKGVQVRSRTEALAIDRVARTVRIRDLVTGVEEALPYDQLVLATGSRPNRLPVPGADLPGVFTVSNLGEAIKIKERIAAGQVNRAVVIGAGAIGLEMVEAMADLWGIDTAVVEVRDQVLPGLVSPAISRMVLAHLAEKGVQEVYLGETVLRIEGDSQAERVVTDRRELDADLVIMAVGVRPNGELAKSAGLDVSDSGAVLVNSRLQTSDPRIWAGGDCVLGPNLVTGRPGFFPSGALANRHGRIIGTNLAGGGDEFKGMAGSFVLKCFERAVAAAGLSLARAKAEGFDAFSTLVIQADRAHFYPGQELMVLELVVDRASGRMLGLQGFSPSGDALCARINAAAVLLGQGAHARDLGQVELAYAPPFSAAVDVLHAAGFAAENILAKKSRMVDPEEFLEQFNGGDGDTGFICLDVRGPENAAPFVARYPDRWVNIPQEQLMERLGEVPRDTELVLVCNSGARSYEAQITLDHHGLSATRNLMGGIMALKKMGTRLTD